MNDEMKKTRDELARQYWNEFVASSNRAHAEILFKDGFDAAMERAKILEEALMHPDIEELPCECGWFDDGTNSEGVYHTCIKCLAKSALASFRGEK